VPERRDAGTRGGGSGAEAGPGLERRDLLRDAPKEWFQVPAFSPGTSRGQRLTLRLRHLLDPGAASIWADLSRLLPGVQGSFLDVGCGAQPYRPLLPPGVLYQGIDRAEARDLFGYSFPDTLYYEGERWPVEDASADWILCTEVLEHVEQPRRFLAEARRCLRPGGRLLLTVPFCARMHYIPQDYCRYTPWGLKVLLEEAGLGKAKVWARGNPLSVACSKVLGLVFPLLVARGPWLRRAPSLLLGLFLSPLAALAGPLSYWTLDWEFGDDCIGFTAIAQSETTR
jgi:SAM-dependent methyltransferase